MSYLLTQVSPLRLQMMATLRFVRQWLLIGQVDNAVIELWLFTCTVAGYLSGKKRGDAMFHVEFGNEYL